MIIVKLSATLRPRRSVGGHDPGCARVQGAVSPERVVLAFDFRSAVEPIARHAEKFLRVVSLLRIQVADFSRTEFDE